MKKLDENLYIPNLDKYIREKRRYKTFFEAIRYYSLPYHQLLRIAKEADASLIIGQTRLVDLDKIDKYIENFKIGDK